MIGYELSVGEGDGVLRLLYRLALTGEQFDYTVRLVATRCHFGGARWWLVCPLVANGRPCGRRVRKLYLSGRYFGCRGCHRLTYRSRQEHDRQVDAVRRGRINLPRPEGAPLKVLGLWLKVLTAEERRYADRPTARHVPAR